MDALCERCRATALQHAASSGRAEMVELLLKHGARIDAGPHTPLQRAAAGGHLEAVKVLLAHKAQVNARCPNCGLTPLKAATSRKHADIAALLRRHGARQ